MNYIYSFTVAASRNHDDRLLSLPRFFIELAVTPLLLDKPFDQWKLGDLPLYRVEQLRHWIFEQGCFNWDEMSNLPLSLRQDLKEKWDLVPMNLQRSQGSFDTTQKFLWKLRDGQFIESVLIPATEGSKGVRASRLTLCVSTQVGCAIGCKFCASGLDGLKRNLSTGEIVGQVLLARNQAKRRIDNLVFMGMGEPLMNYKNTLAAIDKITSPEGLGMSPKRITVSTSGVSKIIFQMADQKPQWKLAVSLHSAVEETRNKIMPFTQKFPLDELKASLLHWYAKTKSKITFEYVVWEGINDSQKEIDALVKFCLDVPSKVNLIEYNPIDESDFRQAAEGVINRYIQALETNKIAVTVRRSRGKDIDAACGQLANKAV